MGQTKGLLDARNVCHPSSPSASQQRRMSEQIPSIHVRTIAFCPDWRSDLTGAKAITDKAFI